MDSLQLTRVNSKLNNTLDDAPGGGNSPGRAPGQLGLVTTVTKEHALQLSDLDVGTLYEGEYQYVQLGDSPTVDEAIVYPDRGLLLFWEDRANFIVSVNDELRSELAGVFLNAAKLDSEGDNIDPAGSYVYMQKVGPKSHGRATVKLLAASTAAEDEVLIVAGDGTAECDRIAVESDFSAITVGLAEGADDEVTHLVVARLGA